MNRYLITKIGHLIFKEPIWIKITEVNQIDKYCITYVKPCNIFCRREDSTDNWRKINVPCSFVSSKKSITFASILEIMKQKANEAFHN